MATRSALTRACAVAALCVVVVSVISSCGAPSPAATTARPGRPSASAPATIAPASTAPGPVVTASPGWRESQLPALPANTSLAGGAAVSGQDAWAVGWSGTGTYRPVVLHWDGRSWSVATVTGIPDMVVLRSVVATGPGQVWVSGLALTPVLGSMSVSGVVYRLEGSRWVRIPLPAGLDPGSLYHGPGDQIWTIGASTGIAGPGDGAPVIADWTGREWHVAYTAPGGAYYDLQSLDIVTSRDGWAAGYTQARAPECFESLHQCRDFSVKSPLLLHWDGASWKREAPPPVPASYSGGGALSYLAAVPASPQRWATGTVFSAAPLFVGTSWLLRWNGTAWTTVTMPVVSLQGQYLYDLDGRWIVAQGVITPSWTPLPDSGMHVIAIPGTRAIGTRATWAIGTAPGNGTTGAPYIEYSALPS